MRHNLLTNIILCGAMLTNCSQTQEANHWKDMDGVRNQITLPTFPDKTFVITDYYNGTDSLYTTAINRAIDECSAQGGGTVLIPNGTYRTAPIRLKSNVNLHLSDSTILQFVTDPQLFPTVLTRIEGIDCHNISPLIYAYDETNIALTGKGVLDGQADTTNWFASKRLKGIDKDGKKIKSGGVYHASESIEKTCRASEAGKDGRTAAGCPASRRLRRADSAAEATEATLRRVSPR